jgi:hypothetical protein
VLLVLVVAMVVCALALIALARFFFVRLVNGRPTCLAPAHTCSSYLLQRFPAFAILKHFLYQTLSLN